MATTVQEARPGAATQAKRYPMYLAGEWVESDEPLDVANPFNGEFIGTTYQASKDQL